MPKQNILLLTIASILLGLFLVLTILAKYDKTQRYDFDTTVRIQDKMPERLKKHLITFVELGNWQVMSVVVFISMLIHRKHFWKIGILYLLIVVVEIYGKYELHHPPPPQFMTLRFQHLDLPPHYIREAASYPSGHAARSAFLVFIWIPYFTRSLIDYIRRQTTKVITDFKLRLPFGFVLTRETGLSFRIADFTIITLYAILFGSLLSFTILIGFIKVYLGEHWMSDVIGGWLLGSAFGLLSFVTLKTLLKKPSPHIDITEENTYIETRV
jgi:membrane-associated phospholipid phosphatase